MWTFINKKNSRAYRQRQEKMKKDDEEKERKGKVKKCTCASGLNNLECLEGNDEREMRAWRGQ